MFITHAAIMFSNGEVVEGIEYPAISLLAHKFGYSGKKTYGFTNSLGFFVTPKDAAIIAFEAGQIKSSVEELTPQDLWPGGISD